MAGSVGEVSVRLAADVTNFNQGVHQAKSELSGLKTSAESSGGGIKSMLGNMLSIAGGIGIVNAAGAAFGAFTGFLSDSVKEASDAQSGQAQLESVIKSTGGAAGVSAQHAQDLASALQKVTTFSDDTVNAAESMLLTFTNIGSKGGIFDSATKTALDMSQALGGDVKSASIQLGKALNDPINGISALSRVGVTFDEQQKNLIKTYVAHGDIAKAQTVILKELQKEFGGSAEAAGKTFGGQLAIAGHKLDEVKQSIGEAVIPVLLKLVSAVQPAIDAFGAWLPGALATASAFISKNVMPVVDQLAKWFFTDGLASIKGFAGFVVSDVVPAAMSVAKWFGTQVLPVLLEVGKAIAANVLPAAQKISSALFENLIPAVQKLWGILSPLLVPVLNLVGWVLGNIVGPAITGTVNLVGGIINKILDFIGVLGRIKDIAGDVFGAFDALAHGKIGGAVDFIKGAINGVAGFFKGIKFEFPHIPLPHFGFKGNFDLNPLHPSVPTLSVDWYKQGGIFSSPSIIGVGDSEKPEVVTPINKLSDMLNKENGGNGIGGNGTANIYIMMDGRMLAQALGVHLVNEIRLRTGIRTA